MRHPAIDEGQDRTATVRAFGCRINAPDPRELFDRYEDAGFLYPEKMDRLKPFWSRILQNWRQATRAGDSLLWYSTYDGPHGSWGSVSSFRTTHRTWNTQHAVAMGGPTASRAALLSAAAFRNQPCFEGQDEANQNWFRPSNRFANKVFGSIERTLGTHRASVETYEYMAMPKRVAWTNEPDIRIVPVEDNRAGWQDDLVTLAYVTRGHVYAVSEELGHDDVGLEAVDEAYRRVGLRRYRRVFLAFSESKRKVVGAAIAYRGPLGLNLSFLENRCDLLMSPGLSGERARSVVSSLMTSAARIYDDFEPDFIPLVTDAPTAERLIEAGGRRVRQYAQAAFLRAGYRDWYRHVEGFYGRILRRLERRTAAVVHKAA